MATAFSLAVSELRRERGLSQRQVAQDLGVSQALLSHYENGLREPKLEFIVRMCDYYGVTADHLLGRTAIKDDIFASADKISEKGREGYLRAVSAVTALCAAADNDPEPAVSRAVGKYIDAVLLKSMLNLGMADAYELGNHSITSRQAMRACEAIAVKTHGTVSDYRTEADKNEYKNAVRAVAEPIYDDIANESNPL